jgi:tetratricopeptide (TPR) repeat protein/transcriptional regulator with XRE-family HTH domain
MRDSQLGEWVRSRRTALLLTQEELASRAGISVRTVQSLETGAAGAPRQATLRLLAAVLGPPPATVPDQPPARRPPVPAQLPADVVAFTGREPELAALDRLLDEPAAEGGSTALVLGLVCGTGGVGKTALAVRWAHRVRAAFTDGQLYVDLRGYGRRRPVAPGEVLTRFINALGLSGAEVPLDEDERATRYRTEVAGRRMLILLDNAASAEQVRPLLPGTGSCVVMVTSRDSLSGLVSVHGARRIELDRLPVPDAVALLRRLLGGRVAAEPDAAATLAEQCARLPLALRVAADLATSRPVVTLAGLVAELADRRRRLDLLDAGGDTRAAVRAVFSWSYEHLPPAAARAFRLVGLHPGPDLDARAAAALLDTDLDQARALLDLLTRAHLSEPTGSGRHRLHDLLRAYAAELATGHDPEPDRRAALTRLFDHYLATAGAAMDLSYPAGLPRRPRIAPPAIATGFGSDPAAARAWLDAERLTLAAVSAYAAEQHWPRHAIDLATTLFSHQENGGHYTDLLVSHTHALGAARRTGDRAAQAHALIGIGAAHHLLSGYRPATTHLEQALALFRELGDRAGQVRALVNLGNACRRLGGRGPAVAHLSEAVALCRELGDLPGEGSALTNLGLAYWQAGRYELAADHYRQSLALQRRVGNQLGEARALDNLGLVYRDLGRAEPAADHHRQALDLFRRIGHRSGEAHALNNLGDAHVASGSHATAADLQQQAHTLFREIGERYGQASALNGLGEARCGAGQPQEAVAHHRAALGIALETGDRDEQARAHTGLGHAYRALGDPARARRHWREAVAGYAELGSPMADRVAAMLARLEV